MISLNIYRHSFTAICPSDGDSIEYRLEIMSTGMIMVEDILAVTAEITEGYHENIADTLFERFGGVQRIVATHQGVEIDSLRRAGRFGKWRAYFGWWHTFSSRRISPSTV